MPSALDDKDSQAKEDGGKSTPNVDPDSKQQLRWVETQRFQKGTTHAIPNKIETKEPTPLQAKPATQSDESQRSENVPQHFVGKSWVKKRRVRQANRDRRVRAVNDQTPGQIRGRAEKLLIEIVTEPPDSLRQEQPRSQSVT